MIKIKQNDPKCTICKGKYWSNDQSKRQEQVRKEFGILPNACVDDQNGKHHCPYLPTIKN